MSLRPLVLHGAGVLASGLGLGAVLFAGIAVVVDDWPASWGRECWWLRPLCLAGMGLGMAGLWAGLGLLIVPVLVFESPVFAAVTLVGWLPLAAAILSAALLKDGGTRGWWHWPAGLAAATAATVCAAWWGLLLGQVG